MSHNLIADAFARSGSARYIDSDLVIKTAAANVARDAHFHNLGTKVLLLEAARTNDFSKSEELEHADWTQTNLASITANNTVAPDALTTAEKIIEDGTASVQHAIQRNTPSLTDNTKSAWSIFAKANERTIIYLETSDKAGTSKRTWFNLSTGAVGTTDGDHTARITTLTNGWYRCEVVVDWLSGGSTPFALAGLADADNSFSYNGDGTSSAFMWGAQFETDKDFATSYIPTTTGSATRNAESIFWPFTLIPQGMTVQITYIDLGVGLQTDNPRIVTTEDGAAGKPRFLVSPNTSREPRCLNEDASGNVQSAVVGLTSAIGDVMEIRAVLFPDGAVQCHGSKNGAAESSGTKSAARALEAAWSGTRIYFTGTSTQLVDAIGILSVKVAPGVQTRAYMRTFGE